MLQYASIIEKLNIDEKLAILTNGSALYSLHNEYKEIPALAIANLNDFNVGNTGVQYPSFEALACSWDLEAVQRTAKGVAARAKSVGWTAAMLPHANLRSTVYADGASEDPYLTGAMLNEYVKGADSVGMKSILTSCSMTKADVDSADVKPNVKAIMEYYLKPFYLVTKEKKDVAIATSFKLLKGEYEKVNVDVVRPLMEKSIAARQTFLLCEHAAAETAVARLRAGYPLCLRGHAEVLKEAVEYYQDLRDAVEAGVASAEDLEEALRLGNALSEDSVNEAVDIVLAFASKCQVKMKNAGSFYDDMDEEGMIEICEKTAVLLKNKNDLLPLTSRNRVAVIGALGEEVAKYVEERNEDNFYGFAQGYDLEAWNNEGYMPEAIELAENADTVIFVVGFDEKRERKLSGMKSLKLPATQAILLEKIAKLKKKLIVVATGSGRLDMSFDSVADAVLYVPRTGIYTGKVITRLLYGDANPSGKLPFTMYDDPDGRMKSERFYKNNGYNKVGTFVGYRRYDTEEDKVKYPFGYGLSYTKFAYSHFRIDGSTVSVTVKNVGHRRGDEVVQFYYGKEDLKSVSPRKELFAFERVSLAPRESITITKELKSADFVGYNENSGYWETERGYYRIYASSSVSDERNSGKYYVIGVTPQKREEDVSDYLQGKSNILSGEYFMDTNAKQMQYKSKAPLFGIITIILAVLYDVFGFVFAPNIEFFTTEIGAITNLVLIILFTALAIVGLVVMIVSLTRRKRFKTSVRNSVLVRDPEVAEEAVAPVPYERLFLEEFGEEEEEEEEEEDHDSLHEKEVSFEIKEEVDHYHREGWKLTDLQDELIAFMTERGVVLDARNARALLTAMNVSRLVMIKTDKDVNVAAFRSALNDFFAVKNFVDSTKGYTTSDDVFFRKTNNGYVPTYLTQAMEDAAADTFAMKFAHLTDVRLSTLGSYFAQLMRYVVRPETPYTVFFKNKEMTDKVYTTTANLWVFLYLGEDEMVENIPAPIAETGAFVKLQFTQVEGENTKREGRAISKAQFLKFGDKARNHFELDENKWKRIDRLEEYVCARANYRISNKLWQKMERFASVYLALGGEAEDALDNVVAVKMLTTLLSLIKFNKKEGDEKLQYAISNIFGEEEMRACNAVIDVSCVDMEDTWQAAKQPVQETEKEEIAPQPVSQPAPQPAPQPVAEAKPAEVEVKITAERVAEPAVSMAEPVAEISVAEAIVAEPVAETPVAEAIVAEPVMDKPKAEPVVASITEEKNAEPAPAPAKSAPAPAKPAPAPAKPAPAPQGVAKMVAATEEADVSLDDLLEGLDFGGDN